MREIKFRAWDGDRMAYAMGIFEGKVVDSDGDEALWFWHEPAKAIMQYTGLKDKNGKEIYEGDVIEAIIRENSLPTMGEIAFDVYWQAYGNRNLSGFTMLYKLSYIKIIGNIYENKELLE